jgi:hypothetical protein
MPGACVMTRTTLGACVVTRTMLDTRFMAGPRRTGGVTAERHEKNGWSDKDGHRRR